MSTSRRYVDNDNIEHQEYESANYQRDVTAARNQEAKTCLKCSHFKVCTIFRNVSPMMEQMFGMLKEEDKPFKAEQIAWLCKWYERKREPQIRTATEENLQKYDFGPDNIG